MMRRLLHNESFQSVLIVLVLGSLTLWGLLVPDAPRWVKACAAVICVLAFLGPALPALALLPWHFIAVHRGLVPRSERRRIIELEAGAATITHGDKQTRCDLKQVSRARRAFNDNWTESKMLEDAVTLFSVKGRALVRVPVSAEGFDELMRELAARGVVVEDVPVSAPAFLD